VALNTIKPNQIHLYCDYKIYQERTS